MPKLKNQSRQAIPSESAEDQQRSESDWQQLPHKTLVLKCGQYHLPAKGRKDALVTKLYGHFHPSSGASRQATNKENLPPTGTPSASTSMPEQNLIFAPTSESAATTNISTITTAGPMVNNSSSGVDTTLLCEAIATLQDQQTQHAQQQRLLQESLQKLLEQGSEKAMIPQTGVQPTFTTNQQQNMPTPVTANLAANTQHVVPSTFPTPVAIGNPSSHLISNQQGGASIIPTPNQQAVHFNVDSMDTGNGAILGFDSHQHLQQAPSAGRINAVHPNNPYLPPPLTPQVLTKIRNKEYVDFGAILFPIVPSLSSMASVIEGDEAEEYCLSQGREPGSSASFVKRSARTPIPNYATWVLAWNAFYEATFHYYPEMAYELFTYFKHIAEYAHKYVFKYLAAYDKTHRMHIAAQRHLPASVQRSSWMKHDPSLFNSYLRDNMHPSCSNCFNYGHFDKQCPEPPNNNKRRQSNSNQQQQLHHAALVAPQPTNQPILPPQPPASSQFRNATPQSLLSNSSNLINIPRTKGGFCFRYNKGDDCDTTNCKYAHLCRKCFEKGRTPGPHPAYQCR